MKIKKMSVISIFLMIMVSLFCVSCAQKSVLESAVNSQSVVSFNDESEYANYIHKEFPNLKSAYGYNEIKRYVLIKDNVGSVHLKYLFGFYGENNMNLECVSLVNLSGNIKVGFIRYNESSSSIVGRFEVRVNKDQEKKSDILKKLAKEFYQEKNDEYVKTINVDIPLIVR